MLVCVCRTSYGPELHTRTFCSTNSLACCNCSSSFDVILIGPEDACATASCSTFTLCKCCMDRFVASLSVHACAWWARCPPSDPPYTPLCTLPPFTDHPPLETVRFKLACEFKLGLNSSLRLGDLLSRLGAKRRDERLRSADCGMWVSSVFWLSKLVRESLRGGLREWGSWGLLAWLEKETVRLMPADFGRPSLYSATHTHTHTHTPRVLV